MDEVTPSTPAHVDKDYRFELYKSLRSEAAGFIEKAPGLWLQKFALAGGVIAFLIANHAEIASGGSGEVIVGAAATLVPILAVLLDIKAFEYGFHARAISLFLADKYRSPAMLAEWEACLWGDGPLTRPVRLARIRNALAVVVTVVPTAALMCLAGIVVAESTKKWALCVGVACGLALLYLTAAVVVCRTLWPRKVAEPSAAADGGA